MIKNKARKGQEEIIGFVVIVLIVMILGLVFLGISLRKTSPTESSVRMENLLTSMLGYTTSCEENSGIKNYDIEGAIKACFKKETCSDGKIACEILEKEIKGMMGNVYPISDDSPTSYYKVNAYYINNQTEEEITVIDMEEGNCSGARKGTNQAISVLPGRIIIEIETCTKQK